MRRVEKAEKVPREAKVAIDGATRTGNPTVRVGRQGIPPSITFHGKGRTMEPVAPLSCRTPGEIWTVVDWKWEMR